MYDLCFIKFNIIPCFDYFLIIIFVYDICCQHVQNMVIKLPVCTTVPTHTPPPSGRRNYTYKLCRQPGYRGRDSSWHLKPPPCWLLQDWSLAIQPWLTPRTDVCWGWSWIRWSTSPFPWHWYSHPDLKINDYLKLSWRKIRSVQQYNIFFSELRFMAFIVMYT